MKVGQETGQIVSIRWSPSSLGRLNSAAKVSESEIKIELQFRIPNFGSDLPEEVVLNQNF